MFLTDEILPEGWSMIWMVISAVIFIYGFKEIITEQRNNPEFKQMFLYALIFTTFSMAVSIFSPFIIGYIGGATYAGMTGMGLTALFFNPWINSVIYLISSAISFFLGRFTATTFGANIFAVAFIGSITIRKTWKILENKKIYIKLPISIIAGNMAAVIITILQLQLAYPAIDPEFIKLFLLQIPMAISEAAIVYVIYNLLPEKIKNRILK